MVPQRGPARTGNRAGPPDVSRSTAVLGHGHSVPRLIPRPDEHQMTPVARQIVPNLKFAPNCTPSRSASNQRRPQPTKPVMKRQDEGYDALPKIVLRCPYIPRNAKSGAISFAQASASGNAPQIPSLRLSLFQELLFRPPTPPPSRTPSLPPPPEHIEETRFHVIRPYSCHGSWNAFPSALPSDAAFTLKRARFDDAESGDEDRISRRSPMRQRVRSTSPSKPAHDLASDRSSNLELVPDRRMPGENPILRRFWQRYTEDPPREFRSSARRAFLSKKKSPKKNPWSPFAPSPLGTQPVRYPLVQLHHPIHLDDKAPAMFPILLWNQQSSDRLRRAWDVVCDRREVHVSSSHIDSNIPTTT